MPPLRSSRITFTACAGQFYRDERTFFQQRAILIKAVTLPARWLDKSGVFLLEPDYQELLDTVIPGIRKHGNVSTVRHFAAYFPRSLTLRRQNARQTVKAG
jgi:hypothetical protein